MSLCMNENSSDDMFHIKGNGSKDELVWSSASVLLRWGSEVYQDLVHIDVKFLAFLKVVLYWEQLDVKPSWQFTNDLVRMMALVLFQWVVECSPLFLHSSAFHQEPCYSSDWWCIMLFQHHLMMNFAIWEGFWNCLGIGTRWIRMQQHFKVLKPSRLV